MAMYKCPALGDCVKANSGDLFERSPGEDLKCPGCSALMELQSAAKPVSAGRKAPLIAAAAIALVAALAGGTYAYQKQAAPAASVASVEPAPLPATASNAASAAVPVPEPAAAVSVANALNTVDQNAAAAKSTGIAPSDMDIKVLRAEGDIKLVKGDAAGADLASNRAVAKEMLKVAISKMAQGKLDDAEKELNEARKRDPKESLVYYNTGVLRLKQGNVDQALSEFEASFMAGFSYFNKMDEDTDLDSLRKDQRFTALTAKYRIAQK